MSEQEFDLYLSLMNRFLKLTPQQRDEIAEELRDHLELRMEELTGEGHTRQEAIHLALEEMGDAGELAQHFSQIATSRRRRFMMRCTAGTVVAVAAAYFLVTAFWPHVPGQPGLVEIVAQDEAKQLPILKEAPSELPPMAAKTKVYKEEYLEEWDEILDTKNALPLEGLSIQDALHELSLQYDFHFIVDQVVGDLTDAMTSETIEKNYENFTLKNMLQYILKPHELAFVPGRDRMLVITTKDESLSQEYHQLRVYDCRDILEKTNRLNLQGSMGGGACQVETIRGISELVMSQTGIASWDKVGGNGTISSFDGMLVVTQTDKIHREIEAFLNLLRKPYLDQSLARSDAEPARD